MELSAGNLPSADWMSRPGLIGNVPAWRPVISGNLLADKSKDHRKAFSNWWQEVKTKALRFCRASTAFLVHLRPCLSLRSCCHNTQEFKTVKFPADGLVFDYCLDEGAIMGLSARHLPCVDWMPRPGLI
eukprot:SAG22_NODE_38_length_26325_cov_107.302067_25_plen_129_part_00